ATCRRVCVRQGDPARLAGWEIRRIVQNRSAAALELRSHCRNPKWGCRANDALHRTLPATVLSAADADKTARRVWLLSPRTAEIPANRSKSRSPIRAVV